MAPISAILRRLRIRNSTWFDKHEGKMTFFCMGLDKPLHVPRGTAKAMVTQLQMRDAALIDKRVRSCCSVV